MVSNLSGMLLMECDTDTLSLRATKHASAVLEEFAASHMWEGVHVGRCPAGLTFL